MEGDQDKYLRDCDAGNDKCVRSFLMKDSATFVENGCIDQAGCNKAIIDCGQYNDVTCKVSCCDVILLTACFALGLAQLM